MVATASARPAKLETLRLWPVRSGSPWLNPPEKALQVFSNYRNKDKQRHEEILNCLRNNQIVSNGVGIVILKKYKHTSTHTYVCINRYKQIHMYIK